MSVWRLQRWGYGVHTKLHKVWLTHARISSRRYIGIFCCGRVLRGCNTIAELNLWWLLHNYTSSWLWHLVWNVKGLNSTIMCLYLLLKSSLSLMTSWRNTSIIWSWIYIVLWANISRKFILYRWNFIVLWRVWHNLSHAIWTKLLAYMQSILNYWSPVGFSITDHNIRLSSTLSISISTFPDILKLSLIITHVIWVINSSIGLSALAIPVVSRRSHLFKVAFSNGLRLPFLCYWLLLSTRILNISRRKLDSVLVSCRSRICLLLL